MVTLPLITGLADRMNRHKLIMSASLSVAILTIFPDNLRSFISRHHPIYSVFLINPVPFKQRRHVYAGGSERTVRPHPSGGGGTIEFSIAATLAGVLVQHYGLKIAFWAGIFFIASLVNRKLLHSEEAHEQFVKKGRASELLKNPHFLLFLLISFCGGISFAALSTYFFPYIKAMGLGESVMGLALTVGTISELPILFFVNRFIKRFTPYRLVIFSLATTGLRFLLLAVAPNPVMVLVVQLLNGCNFPLLSVAGTTYADACAPKGFSRHSPGVV